jgi:dihydrolipoamide dehydrogenase
MDYQLVVIGSGPGGYHAAIRAAQLGLTVACVERDAIGGVCLNVGCIPTKALLHAAETLRAARHAKEFGVDFGTPDVDHGALDDWKAGVVEKITTGVGQLLKGNKVDVIEGEATVTGANELDVGGRTVTFEKLIVATGSRPIDAPRLRADGDSIVDSTGALDVRTVPKRFLCLGGSAIGLEFADVYHGLGSEVTVVEMMDQIVPGADPDVARSSGRRSRRGACASSPAPRRWRRRPPRRGSRSRWSRKDGERETVTVDRVLVAIGRRPNGAGLGLEAIGVTLDDKRLRAGRTTTCRRASPTSTPSATWRGRRCWRTRR